MIVLNNPLKHHIGRPRVNVTPEQVIERRNQGISWRKIATTLAVGTATAIRLYRLGISQRPDIQDPRPKNRTAA